MRGYPYAHGVPVAHASGTWDACAVWPESSDASLGTDSAQVRRWKVVAPYGAMVRRGDILSFNGSAWVVSEDAEPYRSPFTGWAPGTVITVTPAFTHAELDGHRQLAAASMLDSIRIERPTASGFDQVAGRSLFTLAEVYAGPADIAASTGGQPAVEGGEVVTGGTRRIAAPAEVDALEGDRLTVTACPGAPSLVGATWWVTSATYNSNPDRTTIEVREQP